MALTKSTITGRVPLPTDAVPHRAEVQFRLSSFDTEGGDIVLPANIRVVLVDGELPENFALWRNTEGLRGTCYIVTGHWSERGTRGVEGREELVGWIQVGDEDQYALADLLDHGSTPAGRTFWSSLTEVE